MINIKDYFNKKKKICVMGLGYVGLPLAVLLNKKFSVIGLDIDNERIKDLKLGIDKTNELENKKIKNCSVEFTSDANELKKSGIIIVTVPTPIDEYKIPDLSPVKNTTKMIGQYLQKDSIVVYESTVYPGVTEEICIPILEKESGLKWKKDFNVGYSPERINPGDKEHTVEKIKKIVSGDTKETLDILYEVYGAIITAGIHRTASIKTAEAAKVIENIQRDLNIALVNELSIIFHKMNIDTNEVLEAAGTKWNFIKFVPGLVGGHCIGVDPYYLTFKAESLGYNPQVILAGRRINDSMGKYVAENIVKQLIKTGKSVKGSKVLILGLTFKENTSDIRNTRIVDIYNELKEYEIKSYIYDPYVDKKSAKNEYNIELIDDVKNNKPYAAIVLGVKHKEFLHNFSLDKCKEISVKNQAILIDIKGMYDRQEAKDKKIAYWRL